MRAADTLLALQSHTVTACSLLQLPLLQLSLTPLTLLSPILLTIH